MTKKNSKTFLKFVIPVFYSPCIFIRKCIFICLTFCMFNRTLKVILRIFYLNRTSIISTVVGAWINTMKTNFLFRFWFLTWFFLITSLQLNIKRICSLTVSLCLNLKAVWKLGRNLNWNSKSSSLYWYMRLRENIVTGCSYNCKMHFYWINRKRDNVNHVFIIELHFKTIDMRLKLCVVEQLRWCNAFVKQFW